MLSNEDKTAYLALLAKRRRVRFHIDSAKTTSETIQAEIRNQYIQLKELRDQIDSFFTGPIVNLNDYRDFLALMKDVLDKIKDLTEDDHKLFKFILRMEKRQRKLDETVERVVQALRAYHKGRGKVLYLEGKRS